MQLSGGLRGARRNCKTRAGRLAIGRGRGYTAYIRKRRFAYEKVIVFCNLFVDVLVCLPVRSGGGGGYRR